MTGAGYVANGLGGDGVYSIYRVDAAGRPTDISRIIAPSGSGFDAAHVFWPTAVRVGSSIYAYATGFDGTARTLGLWISTDGSTFVKHGAVLSAVGDEGQIGKSQVIYDPEDEAAPFKCWYSAKYTTPPGRSTEIRYAISQDGMDWTRVGTVLDLDEADAEGIVLDFVCRDGETWRMFYSNVNSDGSAFKADEATCSTPGGAYTRVGTIFSPGGVSIAVSGALAPGTRYLPLSNVSGLAADDVLVLSDGTQAKTQRVEVEKVLADISAITVKESIYVSGSGFSVRSVQLTRLSPSFVYRDEAGVLRGHFTGWGQWSGVYSEYTFAMRENAGVWTREGAQLFRPFAPNNLYSFENPSPIRSGPDCGLTD